MLCATTHRTTVHDRLVPPIAQLSQIFVLSAKGMDKIHNTTHTTSPKGGGGMGLHQVFWAYRARYITVMQDILRGPNLTRHMSQNPVPHNVTTLCNYVHAIQQLRAYTTVTTSHQQTRPCGGLSLLDEESEDSTLFSKTKGVVGREEYTRKYVCPDATQPTPEERQIPPGFVPCTINGVPCYHNQKQRKGTAWYSDGSKLSGSHRSVKPPAFCGGRAVLLSVAHADHDSTLLPAVPVEASVKAQAPSGPSNGTSRPLRASMAPSRAVGGVPSSPTSG